MTCRICSSDALAEFIAREHLMGTREQFRYAYCSTCGCVQIIEPPADLSPYYSGLYGTVRPSRFKQAVRTAMYRIAYSGGTLGRCLGVSFPFVNFGALTALRTLGVPHDASVLDVGSGVGRFLRGLRALGFNGRLVGIDPYLPDNPSTVDSVSLYRMNIGQVTGTFDVVTLLHTLEHVVEQRETLLHVARLLSAGGISLVTIPVAGGWAWERYRENWVQLDPPRHIVLHSERSLRLLAESSGLKVRDVIWDSTSFQFWGSEFVSQSTPIVPWVSSYLRAAWRIPFDAAKAAKLNLQGRGDQATFVLGR